METEPVNEGDGELNVRWKAVDHDISEEDTNRCSFVTVLENRVQFPKPETFF